MRNHKEIFEALLTGETVCTKYEELCLSAQGLLTVKIHTDSGKSAGYGMLNNPIAWQIKPKTININGFEVPEPVRKALTRGTTYYIVVPADSSLFIESNWDNNDIEADRLQKGIIHLTKEAAIKHAEALLSFTMDKLND